MIVQISFLIFKTESAPFKNRKKEIRIHQNNTNFTILIEKDNIVNNLTTPKFHFSLKKKSKLIT